jgi:UDP-N-acetylmuramyl pentapeptide phosphotransferase/UDP-N-acetylglucosamine-1-phosphate transferase
MLAKGLFAAPVFARRNVRGVDVPVAVGVLAVLAAAGAHAGMTVLDAVSRDVRGAELPARLLVLVAVLGFGLLGAIDDLAGDHADKGFAGHVRAIADGRLTTGGLKLVGGGILGLCVVGPVAPGTGELFLGAAVVALSANTANLFDRAPGRLTKVAVVAAAALVLATPEAERTLLVGVAAVVGAVLGLFWFDLREELMLGDAGANPLGAALGLGVVLTTGTAVQLVVLGALVVVNVAGDRVSFSAAIERVAALRAVDQLGRRPR